VGRACSTPQREAHDIIIGATARAGSRTVVSADAAAFANFRAFSRRLAKPNYSRTNNTSPALTLSPAETWTSVTLPARSASTSFSIFMASSTHKA
jgi:hypothetical protein